jgi:hypothetical protein
MTVTDKKVMCNGGTSAALSAPVAAGGKIRAIWGQWTHAQGPVMVWMYKCASDFKSCDGSGKKWFKVCPPTNDFVAGMTANIPSRSTSKA